MISTCRVEFTKSAVKEFDRLQTKMRTRIVEALRVLSANPFSDLLKIKTERSRYALSIPVGRLQGCL